MHALSDGTRAFLQGLHLINRPGVRIYVVIPLLINVLVFALLFWVVSGYFGGWVDSLIPGLPEWLAWISWLLWLFFGIAVAIVMFFTFTLLANIIGAPFNSLLAEAVERHLTGEQLPSPSFTEILKGAPAMMLDELRKQMYYVGWMVVLLLLYLIPLVNLAAPFVWVVFSAWVMALQYCDYPMGNHQLKGEEQRKRLREHRWEALGFGGMALLATLIPLFNFLVMPVSVAGATALWVKKLRMEKSA